MTLGVTADLFPPTVTSGVDAFAVCLHYRPDQLDSGIALLPGELFGFGLTPILAFIPNGPTDDPDITRAASITDYIFRRLAIDFLRPGTT